MLRPLCYAIKNSCVIMAKSLTVTDEASAFFYHIGHPEFVRSLLTSKFSFMQTYFGYKQKKTGSDVSQQP